MTKIKVKAKDKEAGNVEMSFSQPTECVKIGEFYISSQYVTIDKLITLAKKLLRDKEVKEILNKVEKKKIAGNYYG